DLNDDGKPDLVVANHGSNTVGVLLGNGDGSLAPQHTFVVGSQPDAVAAADVNGDGKPDLVVATNAQAVTFTGTVTGGTFTLSLGRATTSPLPFDASAADVQDAFDALFGPG